MAVADAEAAGRGAPSTGGRTRWRWIAVACTVGAEYGLLSVAFDADPLRAAWGAGRWPERAGTAAGLFFVVATAALTLWNRRLAPGRVPVEPTSPRRLLVFGVIHFAAFAALCWATGSLFGNLAAPRPALAGAWGALVLAVPTSALAAVFRLRGMVSLARRLRRLLAWALLVGCIAWAAALVSRSLWAVLAHLTVVLAGNLLALFTGDAFFDPGDATLGIGHFAVQVAPVCSGYEGVGLIVVLVSAFLIAERRDVRFPQALLLLPLSVALIILANVLRIAGLVVIGAYVSPALALGGFHARAGWVLFCAVALGVVVWARRSPFLQKTLERPEEAATETAAYLLPLLVWVGAALVTGLATTHFDRWYGVRLVPVLGVLWAYRGAYPRPARPSWLVGPVFGIAAYALWIALAPSHPQAGGALRAAVEGLGAGERAVWIGARVLGSVGVVPVVEELAFRGYGMRRLVRADFSSVSYRHVTVASVLVSSLVFGVVAQHVVAGTLVGILFALAAQRRGRLGDAIVAHAVCNALVAANVLALGGWHLWA